ncbi:MAG TPA: hypothetical protein VFF73_04055 [Planctomycetota bacterium]|nr:hypothetical protein [Planctomycetota bacterium]
MSHRLIVGFLALVLVLGATSAAFAGDRSHKKPHVKKAIKKVIKKKLRHNHGRPR